MLSDHQRQDIWKALDELAKQHRAFPDAKWVMPTPDIEEIENLAAKFQPDDMLTRFEFLFNSRVPDLGIPRTQDFEGYERTVADARIAAVREIERTYGIGGLKRLRDAVDEPFFLGWAIAAASVELSPVDLAEDLESSNIKQINFGLGYAVKRFADGGLDWTKSILPQPEGHPRRASSCSARQYDVPRCLGTCLFARPRGRDDLLARVRTGGVGYGLQVH